jgi:hypothetical protein
VHEGLPNGAAFTLLGLIREPGKAYQSVTQASKVGYAYTQAGRDREAKKFDFWCCQYR